MPTSFIYNSTELDAVNTLLNAIGSTQINTLENPQNADAIHARETLRSAVRDVQSEKWYFNTEENYRLAVDANTKKIPIPANLIAIDFMGRYGEISPYVIRKGYLYDKVKHTYLFDKDVFCNVQWCFDFDELPETAKRYVTARAARQFQEMKLRQEQNFLMMI